MNPEPSIDGARRVAVALEGVAEALAGARLDDLVAAEASLSAAVASWVPRPVSGSTIDDGLLRIELVRLRQALARCRRLGGTLQSIASACNALPGYDGRGARPAASGGSSWEASV